MLSHQGLFCTSWICHLCSQLFTVHMTVSALCVLLLNVRTISVYLCPITLKPTAGPICPVLAAWEADSDCLAAHVPVSARGGLMCRARRMCMCSGLLQHRSWSRAVVAYLALKTDKRDRNDEVQTCFTGFTQIQFIFRISNLYVVQLLFFNIHS